MNSETFTELRRMKLFQMFTGSFPAAIFGFVKFLNDHIGEQ